jgi:hypothetical protein
VCKILNLSKAVSGEAYHRKENLPKDKAHWFAGMSVPCVCGKKMYFKPDNIERVIEVEVAK